MIWRKEERKGYTHPQDDDNKTRDIDDKIILVQAGLWLEPRTDDTCQGTKTTRLILSKRQEGGRSEVHVDE